MSDQERGSVPPLSLADLKQILRQELLTVRDAVTDEERRDASSSICRCLATLPELAATKILSAFYPIRREVDLRSLFLPWNNGGKVVALPVMKDGDLIFRRWQPDIVMERRAFGVSEPPDTSVEILPEVILVPLVGFDRTGARLGYGKGFYDRGITRLMAAQHVMTIGIAFANQEVQSVPVEPHDQRLDMIVTQHEIIRLVR